MARCTHKGCSQDYDPENNALESCSYHPGAPVFHEGLKSWSCCQAVNKPVLDFDEFMKIKVSRTCPRARAFKHYWETNLVSISDRDAPSVNIRTRHPRLLLQSRRRRWISR